MPIRPGFSCTYFWPLKEAKVALLVATLGEHKLYIKKCKIEERIMQYYDIHSQIEKIWSELSEHIDQGDKLKIPATDEHDLSARKLNSYQAQLRAMPR
uniref:Uncharacterized protein n=1 Tax=Aegilops tauschii TaxID=37682 RepID=M8AUT8_AEGTA